MRVLFPIVVICIILSLISTVTVLSAAKPETTAREFLQAMKGGNKATIANLFGNNTCACQPKGGWIAYLNYDSGENYNLAFLVGKPFTAGTFKRIDLPNFQSYLIPWEKPQSSYIDVPLTFNAADYQPFFLPLDLAFGKNMSWKDLQAFAKHPQADAGKAFYVRLRPYLVQGLINSPAHAAAPVAKAVQKKVTGNKAGSAALASAAPAVAIDYRYPTDAGHVTLPNGHTATSAQVESTLPHLKQALLRLKVVRRGQLDRWQIAKFKFESVVLTAGGKDYPVSFKQQGTEDNDL